ncbi:MAG: tRNA (N6-isopentenyl adenosine(37)-C2)-methylthiotransferase MiaB [Succinivibrio dextrinosolvens]|jgi:tRNA-2-methylthio-N6-dimethylallyladenosine synthase|uniref:tRNA (N6-isopentenyl adenosine(37)-C2)-methylthiotransferase MiaB n=1 Tax=uncultured Succinivibrio sp. TaxID=540749 RepID=UPI0025DDF395|nr:tRNA (N6-isopentenyl adenosine(37)-C2)-methylthiotransferase MiaB [uncultured Succinivibrio sp.]MDY6416827.1 tRNA (N6-isopentenyl adenosine(37)-C2)-methylthiotransferase MiaB [Succinivibrio dextrinosolvens]MDY6419200.1 tRNA (N6-isopentenyl adenosine(37)-C2)-methylthiotransferase MiaB [Succinivibrio dextrinosolvens]MDY6465266.1 tRNA (N6-isopentenyl adenosine(37)-C2)-methylthiotransferase MiaB [Succinivibrio dextrinosolvens]MDY6470890.1 tRNA (N6-isopentenyl adenosine(37)-C2)-methylthiotransfer
MTTIQTTLSAPKLQLGSFYVHVWGCQMNVYDGGRIRDLMTAAGFAESSAPRGANIIILVTCAVRAKAEDKVFNQIASWRHTGEINDDTIIALGGCVGAELAEKILDLDKSINIIFGPRTIHRLPKMVGEFIASGKPVVDVTADAIDKFDYLPEAGAVGPSAFVTIMEGCSNKCTYCIVPYTRGEEQSRPVQDIIDECIGHIANGVKEIHLLGQNVNSYHGLNPDGSDCKFSSLLYEIAAIPGVERIRFTTSNPMDFTDDIIEAIKDLPVISDGIHVPIQAGSNRILEAMHRRYTAEEYVELIKKIRAARPTVHISSDFIVGFPGETDEDFNETMKIVNEVKFDQSFSFVYSIRPGTPAAELEDPISKETKMQRLYVLQKRLEELASEYTEAFIGTTQRCLVEGTSRKDENELKSRASSGRIVVFKGPLSLVGQMVDVKITSVAAHTLKGELVNQ